MLTFADRPKPSVFGSHSMNMSNSSRIMGQGGGGGGTSRLKRLSWMLHPSRLSQGLASGPSPLSSLPAPRKSYSEPINEPIHESTGEPLQNTEFASRSISQEDSKIRPLAFCNTASDAETPDPDTSMSLDDDIEPLPQLITTLHTSAAPSAATSAVPSSSSSTASEEGASPTEARKSSISFPTDLPKPEHSPSIQTPLDGLSEFSFGRKSSISSASYRRSRNPSVAPSVIKQVDGMRVRTASSPPPRR
ncbi:hypothetical protein E4U57_004694 [Claviceps arundinis]|uniref:Uncharacterized protein n=1 Tax=Claviceps arundinis TaxID=1623583 RepID=A0A9P7N1V4_9HYPO|nr:hypothetical protein E4U57_004694 [Claviceps arundinis]KAG5977790.1 hypothetical protein E4U56_006909 [Claviceps arundinis]